MYQSPINLSFILPTGPCAYCNIWSPVRYMSYCGKFPFCSVYCTKKFAVYKRDLGELSEISSTQHELKGKMKVRHYT